MEFAEQVALLAAMGFFLVGLLSGIWKYAEILRSPEGVAPEYVNITHRSALLYAFACLLLERMLIQSPLPAGVELAALSGLLFFFGFAVFGYALHGWLKDTDNQLRRPYRLGRGTLPPVVVHGAMVALVVAEVGGFLVLAVGAVLGMS